LDIIIFAPASPTFGGSHAIRMAALAKVLAEPTHNIMLFNEFMSFETYVNQVNKKTLIIIDVPPNLNHDFAFLCKNHLVRVGYEYSGELEVEYNIVPFVSRSRQFMASKALYSGLEFLILRPEIKLKSSKRINRTIDVIISLGAGDTLVKAKEIRKKILSECKDFDVKIILGKYAGNTNSNNEYIIKDPINYYDIINSATYIVTNAGTTLVEAIYLNKKILAWPQNELELEFASYLKELYEFEVINEFMNSFNLNKIVETKILGKNSANKLDGEGLGRVRKLIYDIISTEKDNFNVL
jgi:spore coat polysaccharide biosynthesis predicted glycosyltransferase SpsG